MHGNNDGGYQLRSASHVSRETEFIFKIPMDEEDIRLAAILGITLLASMYTFVLHRRLQTTQAIAASVERVATTYLLTRVEILVE